MPSDFPAAMLDWDLRVHPNEREMTRMSNEWFARLDPTRVPRVCAHLSLSIATNYSPPTYTRNGQLANSPFWLQCVTQMHLMTSYGAYCSHMLPLTHSPFQTAFAWIILLSYSPSMTSWMSLVTMKRRYTCMMPVVSRRQLECSCISSRNPMNLGRSRTSLYSRPSTSKLSSCLSTNADRPV